MKNQYCLTFNSVAHNLCKTEEESKGDVKKRLCKFAKTISEKIVISGISNGIMVFILWLSRLL